MATRTRSRSTGSQRDSSRLRGQAGVLAAAAMAGAAVGLAANYGRKMVVQTWPAPPATGPTRSPPSIRRCSPCSTSSKRPATSRAGSAPISDQDQKRARQARARGGECHLSGAARSQCGARRRRAQRRARLYQDLSLRARQHAQGGPGLARSASAISATMLEEHMRMEEDEVFPAFRAALARAECASLSAAMLREGMKLGLEQPHAPSPSATIEADERRAQTLLRHRPVAMLVLAARAAGTRRVAARRRPPPRPPPAAYSGAARLQRRQAREDRAGAGVDVRRCRRRR